MEQNYQSHYATHVADQQKRWERALEAEDFMAALIHSGSRDCNSGSPPPVKSTISAWPNQGLMAVHTRCSIRPESSDRPDSSRHGHMTQARLQAKAGSTCSMRQVRRGAMG